MKNYAPPQLTDLADVAALTRVLGGAFVGDVLLDVNGNVQMEAGLSDDGCFVTGTPVVTSDFEQCTFNP